MSWHISILLPTGTTVISRTPINDTMNTVLEECDIEIDQQAEAAVGQFQVTAKL